MSTLFKARLFTKDLPAIGALVEVQFSAQQLIIKNPAVHINFTELSAKVAGFNHDQLQLSWSHHGSCSLLFDDASSIKQLRRNSDLKNIAGLAQWNTKTLHQKIIWRSVIGTIACIAFATVFTILQYERVTAWIAQQVSQKTEEQLGQSVLASISDSGTLLSEGAAVDAVKTIGNKLTVDSKYNYQWYVQKNPSVNAFALPGGIIVVNSGLLEKIDNGDELAAVLAHETRHVELKHSLRSMIASAGIASAVLLVLGDVNTVFLILAHQATAQYFNRKIESSADVEGIKTLVAHKMKPEGMISLFHKFQDATVLIPSVEKNNSNNSDKKSKSPASDSKSSDTQIVNTKSNNAVNKQNSDTTTNDTTEEEDKNYSAWSLFKSHPETTTRLKAIQDAIQKYPCINCQNTRFNKAAVLKNLNNLKKESS